MNLFTPRNTRRSFSIFAVIVFTMILSVWIFGGAVIYMLLTNPELIGEFLGTIVHSFRESSGL